VCTDIQGVEARIVRHRGRQALVARPAPITAWTDQGPEPAHRQLDPNRTSLRLARPHRAWCRPCLSLAPGRTQLGADRLRAR